MIRFKILLPDGRPSIVRVREESIAGREGVTMVGRDRRLRVKLFDRRFVDIEAKARKIRLMMSPVYESIRDLVDFSDKNHFGGFTWPLFTVFDEKNSFVGYGMSNLYGTNPLDLLHANTNDFSAGASLRDRLRICAILAVLFHIAHKASLCIGDARPGNIHVKRSLAGEWLVYVIDTDSFQIPDGRPLTSDVGADDYCSPRLLRLARANRPPGYRGLVRVPDDDLHALAVICFQTLLVGHHPFSTTGFDREVVQNVEERVFPYDPACALKPRKNAPVAEYRALPPALRAGFEAAFSRGDYGNCAKWASLLKAAFESSPETAARTSGTVFKTPDRSARPVTSIAHHLVPPPPPPARENPPPRKTARGPTVPDEDKSLEIAAAVAAILVVLLILWAIL